MNQFQSITSFPYSRRSDGFSCFSEQRPSRSGTPRVADELRPHQSGYAVGKLHPLAPPTRTRPPPMNLLALEVLHATACEQCTAFACLQKVRKSVCPYRGRDPRPQCMRQRLPMLHAYALHSCCHDIHSCERLHAVLRRCAAAVLGCRYVTAWARVRLFGVL